jgi:hypothetical protein
MKTFLLAFGGTALLIMVILGLGFACSAIQAAYGEGAAWCFFTVSISAVCGLIAVGVDKATD